MLTACSSSHHLPPFTATGYVADRGVMRIWRKDNADESTQMFTAFSPWQHGATTIAEYRWQGDKLISIKLDTQGKQPDQVNIRFDDRGELSFMQREVNNQKQQLSSDQVALYQFNANRIRETSEALRIGHVVLRQGRWHQNGTVTTCEGETLSPELDNVSLSHIARRQRTSSPEVSIAWLEAPEGSQLLLVANQNFCSWQPRPGDFPV